MKNSATLAARFFLLSVALVPLLSGCQTGEVFVTPELHNRIVDSVTGNAVQKATVKIWSAEVPDARQSAYSDERGFVNVERLKARLPTKFPFVADRINASIFAQVEASGYLSRKLDFRIDSDLFNGAKPIMLTPIGTSRTP